MVNIILKNEHLVSELKIHLKECNIRVIYRILNVPLPTIFKKLLAEDTEVDMWEIVMKR